MNNLMYQLNYRILLILVSRLFTFLINLMEPDQLKHIKLLLLAKQKHINSCFYSYSPYRLSKQLGFSPTKWANAINYFIEHGWASEQNGRYGGTNIVFESLESILPEDLKGFKLSGKGNKLRDIHNQLLIFILKKQQNQQEFVAQIKSDLNQPTNSRSYVRAKKLAAKNSIKVIQGEKIDKRFIISVYSLAKLFNCSTSYASKQMKKLQEDGYIAVIKNIYKVGTLPAISFKYLDSPSSFFSCCGQVYRRELNEYIIQENKIPLSV